MKGLKYYLQAQGIAMYSYTVYFINTDPVYNETHNQRLYRLAGDLTNIILWPAYLYNKLT